MDLIKPRPAISKSDSAPKVDVVMLATFGYKSRVDRSVERSPQLNPSWGAEIRLITLPYAGAGATCYRALDAVLPAFVKPVGHELPGHGTRIRERLVRRCAPLLDDAIERLGAALEPPYALYGHSFGAWFALDLARRLVELGRPKPLYLFVSGRRAPTSIEPGPPLHRMPSLEFRARLAELGGTPAAALADAELMGMFEPILRADLEVLETRDPAPRPPLDVPIHLMLGIKDSITEDQAWGWQAETRFRLQVSYFPGGHFSLIREQPGQVAEVIARDLRGAPLTSESA